MNENTKLVIFILQTFFSAFPSYQKDVEKVFLRVLDSKDKDDGIANKFFKFDIPRKATEYLLDLCKIPIAEWELAQGNE